MHTCAWCGYDCDCDGEDLGGQPQPDDCGCPCLLDQEEVPDAMDDEGDDARNV